MEVVSYLVLATILIRAVYTDLKRHEIDNWPTVVGLVVAAVLAATGVGPVTLKQAAIGFLFGGGLFLILAFWSMGAGDVKLMAMIGAFVGWPLILDVCYLTFVFGALMGVAQVVLRRKRMRDFVPLAPAIGVAVAVALWRGPFFLPGVRI